MNGELSTGRIYQKIETWGTKQYFLFNNKKTPRLVLCQKTTASNAPEIGFWQLDDKYNGWYNKSTPECLKIGLVQNYEENDEIISLTNTNCCFKTTVSGATPEKEEDFCTKKYVDEKTSGNYNNINKTIQEKYNQSIKNTTEIVNKLNRENIKYSFTRSGQYANLLPKTFDFGNYFLKKIHTSFSDDYTYIELCDSTSTIKKLLYFQYPFVNGDTYVYTDDYSSWGSCCFSMGQNGYFYALPHNPKETTTSQELYYYCKQKGQDKWEKRTFFLYGSFDQNWSFEENENVSCIYTRIKGKNCLFLASDVKGYLLVLNDNGDIDSVTKLFQLTTGNGILYNFCAYEPSKKYLIVSGYNQSKYLVFNNFDKNNTVLEYTQDDWILNSFTSAGASSLLAQKGSLKAFQNLPTGEAYFVLGCDVYGTTKMGLETSSLCEYFKGYHFNNLATEKSTTSPINFNFVVSPFSGLWYYFTSPSSLTGSPFWIKKTTGFSYKYSLDSENCYSVDEVTMTAYDEIYCHNYTGGIILVPYEKSILYFSV